MEYQDVICSSCGESFPIEYVQRIEDAPLNGHYDPKECPICGKLILSVEDGIAQVEE